MTKFLLCLLATLTLPVALNAQQLTASLTDPVSLPDAPTPQRSFIDALADDQNPAQSSSSQDQTSSSQDQTAPQAPQQPETAEQRKQGNIGDALSTQLRASDRKSVV